MNEDLRKKLVLIKVVASELLPRTKDIKYLEIITTCNILLDGECDEKQIQAEIDNLVAKIS